MRTSVGAHELPESKAEVHPAVFLFAKADINSVRASIAARSERSACLRVSPRPTIKLIANGPITSSSPRKSMNLLIVSNTNPCVALKIWVAAAVGS